jgi:hypothetical protein
MARNQEWRESREMLATGASTEKLNEPDMGVEVAPNAGQARKRKICEIL